MLFFLSGHSVPVQTHLQAEQTNRILAASASGPIIVWNKQGKG